MATLCIDAGTTLIKAVVFDESGKALAISKRETKVLKPSPEYSEQNMNEVWQSVVAASQEAIKNSGVAQTIGQIALTAQGDGAWIIDQKGEPVRSAILWNDGRASKEVSDWQKSGVLDKAFKINGSLTSLGLPNAIIANLEKTEPDSLSEGNKILTCGSWIYFKLTGKIGLHISEASAPWLDIETGEVSEKLFELYGLTNHRHLIPKVFSPQELNNKLLKSMSEELGIESDVSAVLAPYDIITTATGSGVTEPGQAFAIIGTTLCPGTISNTPKTEGLPIGLNLNTGNPDNFLRAFPTITGAGLVPWAALTLSTSLDELTELALEAEAGANGVLVLPYFSKSGERAPFLAPSARGAILGATLESSKGDIARAVFESLAHAIRECIAASEIQPTSIALCGGGAHNDFLCQVIADVTGIPTHRTLDTEVGSKGAFIYAAVATGLARDIIEACEKFVISRDSFTPNTLDRDVLDRAHEQFIKTRNALFDSVWTESN